MLAPSSVEVAGKQRPEVSKEMTNLQVVCATNESAAFADKEDAEEQIAKREHNKSHPTFLRPSVTIEAKNAE